MKKMIKGLVWTYGLTTVFMYSAVYTYIENHEGHEINGIKDRLRLLIITADWPEIVINVIKRHLTTTEENGSN